MTVLKYMEFKDALYDVLEDYKKTFVRYAVGMTNNRDDEEMLAIQLRQGVTKVIKDHESLFQDPQSLNASVQMMIVNFQQCFNTLRSSKVVDNVKRMSLAQSLYQKGIIVFWSEDLGEQERRDDFLVSEDDFDLEQILYGIELITQEARSKFETRKMDKGEAKKITDKIKSFIDRNID